MKNKINSVLRIVIVLFIFTLTSNQSKACYATFTHTNACAGDTIFFNATDQYAVYTWDFGDTASGVGNISHDTDAYHIFVNPGTYFVTLFVNIGSQWDYRSMILNIGTDCFNAAFSSACSGSSFIDFTNESTGDNISSFWNFGDTASGTSDTSSLTNPYHYYSSPGIYTVTLITTDGTQSDTVVQNVEVGTNCLDVTFYNELGGDCVQNVTTISAYISGQATSYLWDFGDPASGAANTSTDSIGVHQFSGIGVYLLTLIVSDGIQTDTFYNVQNIIDCTVWPGNTNRDGEVNMEDLFTVGIYYNDGGTARLGASSNWSSQPANDWYTSGSNGIMYLQDMVDKKNADCNGDGVVNAMDISAIQQNYGRHLPNYNLNDRMAPVTVRPTDPTLQVVGSGIYNAGGLVQLPIQLSSASTIQNVYGISSRIYYDPTFIVPGSVSISYMNSWIGNNGIDMITLYKDFPLDGYVDFGMVRTNQTKVTGNGEIAQLNFILRPNVTGTVSFSFDPAVKLISNGNFNHNQEIFYPVNVAASSIGVVVTGINDFKSQNYSVYPNPAKDEIRIKFSTTENVQTWVIVDALGKICLQGDGNNRSNNEQMINTSSLAEGVYTLKLATIENSYSQLVVIKK